MNMIDLINTTHPFVLAFGLIFGGVIIACLFQIVIRKRFGHELLSVNNEVAGFKYAVQGVAYAVLLAFVVVVVWDEYRASDSVARSEARSVIDLFRFIRAYPDADTKQIQQGLIDYAVSVKDVEWTTMTSGEPNPDTTTLFHKVASEIADLKPVTFQQLAIYQRSLDFLRQITDDRKTRVENADGNIPGVLWIVLFSGAFITLLYPGFFGQKPFVPQVLMTAALALTITLILYLIVALNFPFSGFVKIEPKFFETIVDEMRGHLANGLK